jgi:6-phosphogluconolactonase
MRIETVGSQALPGRAAELIADEARRAIAERGTVAVAFSGGSTPAAMLAALAGCELPWEQVQVFQVDERAAPDGHPDRNAQVLRRELLDRAPVPAANAHLMAAADADLHAAADAYAAELRGVCGDPPVLDLVHLGLGSDGHTASLTPGDPAVEVSDRDVVPTGLYAGRRRLTLTLPALNRARRILWLVSDPDKRHALDALAGGDPAIPAGRVARDQAVLLTDLDVAAASS